MDRDESLLSRLVGPRRAVADDDGARIATVERLPVRITDVAVAGSEGIVLHARRRTKRPEAFVK